MNTYLGNQKKAKISLRFDVSVEFTLEFDNKRKIYSRFLAADKP